MNIKAFIKTIISIVSGCILVIAFSALIYYYPVVLLIVAGLCVTTIIVMVAYIIYDWFDKREYNELR